MTSSTPRKVLYCESNVDGTIGGSHYCLLWLVENLDRSRFTPLVVFYQDHALVPRSSQLISLTRRQHDEVAGHLTMTPRWRVRRCWFFGVECQSWTTS